MCEISKLCIITTSHHSTQDSRMSSAAAILCHKKHFLLFISFWFFYVTIFDMKLLILALICKKISVSIMCWSKWTLFLKKKLTAVLTLLSCVFQCVTWCHSSVCHCNSHKRSNFWNNLRNGTLLGGLKTFNLTLSEIDAHLRHAGTRSDTHLWTWRTLSHLEILRLNHLLNDCHVVSLPLDLSSSCPEMMLQSFRQQLAAQFSSFLKGKPVEEYGLSLPNPQNLVYEWVTQQSCP